MKAGFLGQNLAVAQIKNEILSKVNKGEEGTVFLAFFDMDGTIIQGDITEGLKKNPSCDGYEGLMKLAILEGLCHVYQGEKGYQKFLEKYHHLVKTDELESIKIISEMVENLPSKKRDQLNLLIQDHFKNVLKNKFFTSSLEILKECIGVGVIPYVISASPDSFVKGAEGTLPFARENLLGVSLKGQNELPSSEDHLHHGPGKVAVMRKIISKYQERGDSVQVIAGFGNNWEADGPFLKEISRNGGLGVLINGINKDESEDLEGVHEVQFAGTVGEFLKDQ